MVCIAKFCKFQEGKRDLAEFRIKIISIRGKTNDFLKRLIVPIAIYVLQRFFVCKTEKNCFEKVSVGPLVLRVQFVETAIKKLPVRINRSCNSRY